MWMTDIAAGDHNGKSDPYIKFSGPMQSVRHRLFFCLIFVKVDKQNKGQKKALTQNLLILFSASIVGVSLNFFKKAKSSFKSHGLRSQIFFFDFLF